MHALRSSLASRAAGPSLHIVSTGLVDKMRIFTVLFLALLAFGALRRSDAQTACTSTLKDALANTPALSQLNAVVVAAGLQDTLDDPALNVTVFAPNNSAIEGLVNLLSNAGLNLSDVTAQGSNRAASIILYHIANFSATSVQLMNAQVLPTLLQGYNLTVEKNTTTVRILGAESNATVITPNVPVCKSTVHIIDNVLLPASLAAIPVYTPSAPGSAPSPPGTVTLPPPPPGPGNAGVRRATGIFTGAVAAAVVAVFTAL
ncbi:hypothetical protein R1sor_009332 [Riccia sorocarpa]|uniref:FAS1 domain-containing protein n=1 Tax=Riccia sorocarpa TaxID=122646 RepID=A0ABD3HWQ0_9MARC